MTCLSAKICKHAKDCDIHMCSNTIEKCRAFNRKPNNNEEWLRSATTEQLAEWIASVVKKAISINKNIDIVMLDSAILWKEWLQQPYREE